MDINSIINERRSARSFTGQEVSDEQIESIIKSAAKAPTAKNRQPWKFYILSREQKDNIAEMLLEWEKHNKKEKSSAKGTAIQIKSSSRMIMVYRDSYRSKEKANDYRKPDYISLGCAIENMSLQAIHLGLGSCILCDTLYIEKEIDDYLNISNYEQICGFIVGYPIYDYPPKKKKEYEDLLLN